jgi:hypothetical protein
MPQQDALAAAKKTLAGADKFEKEADPTGAQKPKPTPAPVAAKPAMSPKAGAGLGAELNAKAQNVTQYTNAVPQYHKGGVVKDTGLAMLEKGETVRTKEQEKAMADEKSAMPEKKEKPAKKASPEALMTSEDKGSKAAPKSEKKDSKKGGFTETRIQHHNHGGHHVHHVAKDNPDKDVHYAAQDMNAVKAGLDQHVGDGVGGGMAQPPEPMPNAEQAAAAPPAGGAPQAAMPQQV